MLHPNYFNLKFNIFYNEKVNNTVIENSHFIRINYSNELFTLTGLFLKIDLNINDIEKYFDIINYARHYCTRSSCIY